MVDPEARRGSMGADFDGHPLDVRFWDADSAVLTALNVLAGNGNEGTGCCNLLVAERAGPGEHCPGAVDRWSGLGRR